MTKEFKKIVEGKQTRYVLEFASGGATGSAAITSDTAVVPGIRRRTPEADQKVPQKPRQGPLRQQTGAGKHKDKKRDDKQGKAKHKKPFYEDHEVSMASNELKSIYSDAKQLLDLVQQYGEQGDLEAWQQSKITKAADYLNSVLQSIGGEHTDLDELKGDPNKPDPNKVSQFQRTLQTQKDRFAKQGFARAADDTAKLQKKYKEPLSELEKPSGTLYIIVLKDRSDSVRVVGDFGTFPAEVQARASKVGLKDKEGRKERPLKVNFLMTSASQALAELDRALADVDFIGGEKAEFVFKNSAFDTDINAEVNELLDLIKNGADERFAVYDDEKEIGNEPPRKLKGVDHYIIDPLTGEKRRVPKQGKPSSQMGGHAVQQPKTYTYRLQRTDLAPKLRDMGFKFDGNNIILSKQQRDQLLAKMGDKQFGMIFGQGDRFAEGWKGGMAGAGIGAALTRSPSGAMTGYKVGSAVGDMVGKKENSQDSEEHMNQTVSDLHREIYGFGPGKQFVYEWQKMSYDEKAKVYNKLKHLAGKLQEARYSSDNDQFSYGGRMPATDRIPQDSTRSQNQQQAMVARMKQQTIADILDIKPDWGQSDLELMTATELNQILRDLQFGGMKEAVKKPNATTRHLRQYPVSDKDVAKPVKPVKKPEKQKPEQGVAEGYTGRETKDGTWRVFKDGKAVAVAGPFKSREEAAAWIKKQKQGVAEGSSYQTDSMVSHISQIITDIYPQGGDKNTYMKLVAQKMPSIVKADPKLFRRAFGIAYDRFFHIGQDDDDNFDYTDYSMRQGERGMEEGKIKGVDGKACWKGKRYAGKVKKADGTYKDKCVPVGEDAYMESLWDQLDEYKFTSLPYKGQKKEKKAPFALGSKHIGKGKETNRAGLSGMKANTSKDGNKPVVSTESAPPGDKYERMVKHIKKGYSKDGKITDKERSIAYATAWKAKNKAKK